MFTRKLNLNKLLEQKSFFLLGPRGTGKSTLIKTQLASKAFILNLLEGDLFHRLSSRPQALDGLISAQDKTLVVIDEVQKIPALLDEVHRLIEDKKYIFLLTGSSARKLKGHQANLLAGRAWMSQMHPLSWSEIPQFKLDQYLLYGGLPAIYNSRSPDEELRAYTQTYLYEEIRAEALARNIPAFARFLDVAALASGELINFANISSDSGVPVSTVREYYFLLEDTLMGFMLKPWTKSKKRKAIQTSKFYFFDIGVQHSLTQIRTLERNSDLYGRAFEHFIGMEIRAYLSYSRSFDELTFWRSVNKQEVDFVIGDHTAIEVKASSKSNLRHVKGLQAMGEEKIMKNLICINQDPLPSKENGIWSLPWNIFLEKLWGGELF